MSNALVVMPYWHNGFNSSTVSRCAALPERGMVLTLAQGENPSLALLNATNERLS
jgi:hypothetical protein